MLSQGKFTYQHKDQWSNSRFLLQRLSLLLVQTSWNPCSSCYIHCKFCCCDFRQWKALILKIQSTTAPSCTDHTDACITVLFFLKGIFASKLMSKFFVTMPPSIFEKCNHCDLTSFMANSPLWFPKWITVMSKKQFTLADHSFTTTTTMLKSNWHVQLIQHLPKFHNSM